MAEIRIISSGLVQGASGNNRSRIELTPWDLHLLLVDSIQKGVLLPKPNPHTTSTVTDVIDHLKLSLSKTLDFFPPLAGRLGTQKNDDDDFTVSFFVDCNNQGVQFVHAVADGVTLADIIEPTYVPSDLVLSFFSPNGVPNLEGISKPLLVVQVTELVDGFFIGCSMNHSVADGTSFWKFVNSWSEISRNSCGGYSDVLSNPPVFQPYFPDDVSYPIRIRSCDIKINDEPIVAKSLVPPLLLTLTERVFHFTKESIAKLKARANSEAGTQNISSLQALLAHLWRTITRWRNFSAEQEVVLLVIIGARDRLNLPKGYFGNAIYAVPVTTTAAHLDANGLGGAAMLINKHVAQQTSEEVKKWYVDCARTPTFLKKSVLLRHKLVISSSPRFDMYGNDFGWGKPVAVRSGAGNKYDGKITLFAGAKDGDIDVEICLSPETFHAVGTQIQIS